MKTYLFILLLLNAATLLSMLITAALYVKNPKSLKIEYTLAILGVIMSCLLSIDFITALVFCLNYIINH